VQRLGLESTVRPRGRPKKLNKIGGDDSEFNGTPAISGNLLFLRSDKFLYCIGKQKASSDWKIAFGFRS